MRQCGAGARQRLDANGFSTLMRHPAPMAHPASVAESAFALPHEPFANATARVNEWRGRCLDAFTRAETHATECLAAMAGIDGRGHQVDLPHLVGQRLDALSAAIGPQGPFAQEGRLAVVKLEKFRGHMQVRTMLCHGAGKVTLDLQGRWTVVLRLVSLRSKRSCVSNSR